MHCTSTKNEVSYAFGKCFLLFSMSEDVKDVLRFLWVDDVMKEKPEVAAL